MSRKLRPTKSAHQIKDCQMVLMLGENENDVLKVRTALNDKNKQLADLWKFLKAVKTSIEK